MSRSALNPIHILRSCSALPLMPESSFIPPHSRPVIGAGTPRTDVFDEPHVPNSNSTSCASSYHTGISSLPHSFPGPSSSLPSTPSTNSILGRNQDPTHDLQSYPDQPPTPVSPPAPTTSRSASRSPSPSVSTLPYSSISKPITGSERLEKALDAPRVSTLPTIFSHGNTSSSHQHSPPLPTLPTQSVRFATSPDLRHDRSKETGGFSSLDLLTEPPSIHSHVPDLLPPSPTTCDLPSVPTTAQPESGDDADNTLRGPSPSHLQHPKADLWDPLNPQPLGQNADDTDARIFKFSPSQLASLVDPKNFRALRDLGGDTGILRGLGTNAKTGLSTNALTRNDRTPPSQSRDRSLSSPAIVVTSPGEPDESRSPEGGRSNDGALPEVPEVFSADLEERRRVFGHNILPSRRTKSLLELVWLALKDKVLVWRSWRYLVMSNQFEPCYSSRYSFPLLHLCRLLWA